MSLPGVLEDVTDIILNVKNLIVKLHAEGSRTIRVHSEVKGPITAGMIETDPAVEVINKDMLLATLTDNVPFEMELVVQSGAASCPPKSSSILRWTRSSGGFSWTPRSRR